MIDTGATRGKSGSYDQYEACCKMMERSPQINLKLAGMIKFGIGNEQSTGIVQIDVPIGQLWLYFHIHVVKANVPILVYIDDMDAMIRT